MLETELCGINLKNPTILASGILGVTRQSLKRVAKSGAGAVTIKSVSIVPREGHHNPTIICNEHFMMNAVGYSNSGVMEAKKEFSNLKELGVPVIASVIGKNKEEFVEVVKSLSNNGFSAIEIPLSCPHTPGYGTLAGQGTPEATYEITKAVRKATSLPLFVKLSPNLPEIGIIAKSAEKAGADAITAVNTLGPGMAINIEMAKPVLDFKVGGVSGYALKPVAVRCIYDIYESVKIPIIGVGGIMNGRDAIESIMAGASAVGIGSAVYYRGMDVFRKVCNEMQKWMKKNNYKKINEMKGIAHGNA